MPPVQLLLSPVDSKSLARSYLRRVKARPALVPAPAMGRLPSEGEGHTLESCRVRHFQQSTLSRLTGCLYMLPRSHSDLRIRRIHTKVALTLKPTSIGCGLPQIPASTLNKIGSQIAEAQPPIPTFRWWPFDEDGPPTSERSQFEVLTEPLIKRQPAKSMRIPTNAPIDAH
jgi:hypothetical protein